MRMTIGRRIICGFAVVVLLAAGLGVFAYTRLTAIDKLIKTVSDDCLPGAIYSGKVESLVRRGMVLTQRHTVSEDKQRMDKTDADLVKNNEGMEGELKMYEDAIASEEDRRLFAEISGPKAEFRRIREEVLVLSRDTKSKEAIALIESKRDRQAGRPRRGAKA